jgi:deoxyribonuclease V
MRSPEREKRLNFEMLLAVDVDYRDTEAYVSGVAFEAWDDATPKDVFHSVVDVVEAYEAGNFYLREMPCIMQLIQEHGLSPVTIIIDGYVYLGDTFNPGLGMHLYHELKAKIPVIGVAKKAFKGTPKHTQLLRGNSATPLYITSVGIDLNEAKRSILSMHGNHRLPTLLKVADRECRKSG